MSTVLSHRLALTEQLLMTTSCEVLVITQNSGFSTMAALMRHALAGGKTLFTLYNGTVIETDPFYIFAE